MERGRGGKRGVGVRLAARDLETEIIEDIVKIRIDIPASIFENGKEQRS